MDAGQGGEEGIQVSKRKPHPHDETRSKTNAAIKLGLLVRQPCEVCGAGKADAHHPDYSDHMNVKWLCEAHHIEEHRRLGTLGRPWKFDEPSSGRLSIKLTAASRAEWNRKAREAGQTLSDWIRAKADAACDAAE